MKITATLSRYLAQLYTGYFLMFCGGLLGIVYLFDSVELLRRASKREGIPFSLVLEMGLYKLPETGQTILPFAVLFSAIFTFWVLARRQELVVVRAAGFSVWQFLAPVMGVAALVGVFQFAVINPVGAVFLSRYEALESQTLSRGEKDIVTLFDKGLWLRQMQTDPPGYVILHAERISLPGWEMQETMALFFDEHDAFIRRIDAGTARLSGGNWVFEGALVHQPQKPPESQAVLTLPTSLTPQQIEESFASPMAHSFWRLPGYIRTLTDAGFDATVLKIHFQSLLAQPVLFMAMVLLAATVSLRPPRLQRTFGLIVSGVMIGFLVFFLSNFLQALGASQQIPALLAAWAPGLVTLLLGVAVMLNLEDG